MNDKQDSPYVAWEIAKLIRELSTLGPTSNHHYEVRAAIQSKLTDALVESIDKHEKASSRLAIQVLVLNIVLGVFTVAGTVLAVIAFVQE